jgi:hypothetical protein
VGAPLFKAAPLGAEADADAREVKDLLDEVGAIRITD